MHQWQQQFALLINARVPSHALVLKHSDDSSLSALAFASRIGPHSRVQVVYQYIFIHACLQERNAVCVL